METYQSRCPSCLQRTFDCGTCSLCGYTIGDDIVELKGHEIIWDDADYERLPSEVQKLCQWVGQCQMVTPEEVWEKAKRTADILALSSCLEGLFFLREVTRTEYGQKKGGRVKSV